ncbi:response regulator transcription factor [Kroppenstedtia pulmonis]|uniref:Response regulator transcription factor n=1 Tax=Kroppenstedtia pulmonis TaxID=1380685 RepID=A0A7D3XM78_9BACL|nr:response regulator transcription factor [Kroppenstedtia pulmonis]QKG84129.1 response regulator transcription factor [Kroppenstedtia pulmonis]
MEGKILIVDDEIQLLDSVSRFLRQEGFKTETMSDGRKAPLILKESSADLVLLDWMMPEKSGLEICRDIRSFSDVPIIFLTAKSEETDKLLGLELGGDDYITKPFSMRELSTRIRVVLRRVRKQETIPDKPEIIQRGSITIDPSRHQVWIATQELVLTPTEYQLLIVLVRTPGRVYSRLQLVEMVLGEEYLGYERSIDTHIHNLRKKMEQAAGKKEWIQTVFGVGYKFGEEH